MCGLNPQIMKKMEYALTNYDNFVIVFLY